MSNTTECPNCSLDLKFESRHIGKKVRCKRCSQVFVIPLETAEEVPIESDFANFNLSDFGVIDQVAFEVKHTLKIPIGPSQASSSHSASKNRESKPSNRFLVPWILAGSSIALLVLVASSIGIWLAISSLATRDNLTVKDTGSNASAVETKAIGSGRYDKSEVAYWSARVEEARSSQRAIYVQFFKEENQRKVRLVAHQPKSPWEVDQATSFDLPDGVGMQLEEFDEKSTQRNWLPKDTMEELIDSVLEADGYKVTKLIRFNKPFESALPQFNVDLKFRSHQHLWAPDGNTLYVREEVPFNQSTIQQLLKIDTRTWKVVAKMQLADYRSNIIDMCLTSQGIAIVHTNPVTNQTSSLIRDMDGNPWVPMLSTKYNETNITIVDFETLRPKRSWSAANLNKIAGNTGNELVYGATDDDGIVVVNIKTGQIVNAICHPRDPTRWKYQDKNRRVSLSADGKSLFASDNMEYALHRYKLDGFELEHELTTGLQFTSPIEYGLSPNGTIASFRTNSGYETLRTDTFEQPHAAIPGPEKGKYVYDDEEQLGYLCGRAEKDKPLRFSAIGESERHNLNLNVIDPKTVNMNTSGLPHDYPYSMSISPDHRGVIIIDYDAVYFVEPKRLNRGIAQASQQVESRAKAGASKKETELVLKATRPTPRLDLPIATNEVIDLSLSPGSYPGKVWGFPDGKYLSSLASDPLTGDIAFVGSGETEKKKPYAWVAIASNESLQGTTSKISKVLTFREPLGQVLASYKQYQGKSYLVLMRDQVIWILDPKTLAMPPKETGILGCIDLREVSMKSDPPIDSVPKENPLFEHPSRREPFEATKTLKMSRKDDPWIVVGTKEENLKLMFNFTSGELMQQTSQMVWANWLGTNFDTSPFETLPMAIGPGLTQVRGREITSVRSPMLVKRPFYVGSVGEANKSLSFYTEIDRKPVQSIPVFEAFLDQKNGSNLTKCFDDFPHDRLILQGSIRAESKTQSAFWLLPYSDAGIPDVPSFETLITLPDYLAPDRLGKIAIDMDARLKLSLIKGPEGAKVDENQILWTPRPKDIGEHEFTLQVSSDGMSQNKTLKCSVSYLSLRIPSFQNIIFSADNAKSIVVSEGSLTLINLADNRILASQQTSRSPKQVHVVGKDLYILYTDDHILEKRNLDDLGIETEKHLRRNIRSCKFAMDRFLFLFDEPRNDLSLNDRFYAFELPTFQQTKLTHVFEAFPNNLVQTADGEWMIGPVLMDKELKVITTLLNLDMTGAGRFTVAAPSSGVQAKSVVPSDNGDRSKLSIGNHTLTCKQKEFVDQATDRVNRELEIEIENPSQNKHSAIKLVRGLNNEGRLFHSGDKLVVTANNYFHAFNLSEFEITFPPVDKVPVPLRVRPIERFTVLGSTSKGEIKYMVNGGVPPYRFNCELPEKLKETIVQNQSVKVAEVDSEKLKITINSKHLSVATLKASETTNFLKSLVANRRPNSTPDEFLTEYINEFNRKSKSFTPQTVKGVPILVPLRILVTDAANNLAVLSQDVVLVLSKEEILERIKLENLVPPEGFEAIGRAERRFYELQDRLPDSVILFRNAIVSRGTELSHSPLPSVQWPITNEGTPASLSDEIRRMWPKLELSRDVSLDSVMRVVDIFENSNAIQKSVNLRAVREWNLIDKSKVEGAFDGFSTAFPNGINISQEQKDDFGFKLPPKKRIVQFRQLTDQSLQNAFDDLRKLPRIEPSLETTSQTNVIGNALIKFYDEFGCFPPPAILDKDGNKLLSWRVMLLPYLGYAELFELFHLEEAWDSPHNIKLLPCMPLIYSPVAASDPNKATLLALAGPGTAFPGDKLQRLADMRIVAKELILLLEVEGEFAVEWTKPEDIQQTTDNAWFNQLQHSKERHVDGFRGWFADGMVREFTIEKGKLLGPKPH